MRAKIEVPHAIEWHEGLLLAPQHFQHADRRHASLVANHVLAANAFGWGISNWEYDAGMLAAGTLRLTSLSAILPDGLQIDYQAQLPDAAVVQIDLGEQAEAFKRGELPIYLGIVASSRRAGEGARRYRSVLAQSINDDISDSGAVDIPLLQPDLHLFAGEQPSGQFVAFCLTTVIKENEMYRVGEHIPPLLAVDARSTLAKRVNRLVAQMRDKAAFLAKQTAIPSSKAEDRLNQLEIRERLNSVVIGLPMIEAVLRTPSLPPYTLYLALCSLLGPLSMLRMGAVPPVPPVYQHENLRLSFDVLLGVLGDMVEEVSQSYAERKFEYQRGQFSLPIEAAWLGGRLVIGMRGQSERDIVNWLQGAIVGSESVIASLRERRVLGAARSRIEAAEELGLRGGASITLFAIDVNPALIMPDQALVIVNPAESANALRPSEITLFVKG
ncbi:MAG: type VI secretion system baseplate subunit TssK [Burkholderiales bacterium]|nr:type VI secretion system baseplate subunit TssK [Burkholderiales bacterium]